MDIATDSKNFLSLAKRVQTKPLKKPTQQVIELEWQVSKANDVTKLRHSQGR